MSTCLITEVKQQWAMLVLGWVATSSALLVSLMTLRLTLMDRNPFQPCWNSFQMSNKYRTKSNKIRQHQLRGFRKIKF